MKENLQFSTLLKLLKLFNSKYSLEEYLNAMVDFLVGWTGCENIGVRVKGEDGIAPYLIYRGFDPDFLASECCISVKEDNCICLRVMRQSFDKEDQNKLSEGGSYCSNDFVEFVNNLGPEQMKKYRGKCAIKQYNSVAVIPLVHHDSVMGAIHLADPRKEAFTPEIIRFIEVISPLIAEAIKRYHLEQEVEKSAYNQYIINGLFEGTNALAYVSDLETHRILYASQELNDLYRRNLVNDICYKALFNLESRCEFCQQQTHEEEGEPSLREVYNSFMDKHLLISDKLIPWPDGRKVRFLFSVDISERRKAEERYQAIFNNSGSALVMIDEKLQILLANNEAEVLFGLPREELEEKRFLTDFIKEEDRPRIQEYNRKRLREDHTVPRQYEVMIEDSRGRIKDILVSAVVLPHTSQTILSIMDITERKKVEERLFYLSYHDQLTQLFNRVYFEQEVRKRERNQKGLIGLILCDVNGLKLINTTFGNEAGDKVLVNTANVLKNCFKDNLIARIGGDEFAILIDYGLELDLERACYRLRQEIQKFNQGNQGVIIDLAIGYAISNPQAFNFAELMKNADSVMCREKLHHSKSTRSSQVQILTKALEARDFITEGHADRVQELIQVIGRLVGMTEHQISDLRLLAQFHDIGKVGIPDQILFKKGRLSFDEWAIMKTHSEIGCRIAQSAPDLQPIAEWILKHHENWDGSGYPLKLSGEEIPIACRILAVADAFDAMTNDRPYRKAKSIAIAVEEIKRCSGTQFDPQIVKLFTETVEDLWESAI